MNELDPDVLAFYERGLEAERLTDSSPIEFSRTVDILRRVLPEAPGRILDIGGGPGRYAQWLCEQGYTVDLIDPVPLHIEQAAALDAPGLSANLGDSRALEADDGSADIVLLMGPLYHFPEPGDRARSLKECWRVLRPGGVIVAAAITRWAPLFDLVMREVLSADELATYWAGIERTGGQRATDAPSFTTAYFHRPADLNREVSDAGFTGIKLIGVEGIALFLSDHLERMADADRGRLVTMAAEIVENEPALVGLSPHVLAVATK